MKHLQAVCMCFAVVLVNTGCTSESAFDREDANVSSQSELVNSAQKVLTDVFGLFPFDENGPFEIPSNAQVCLVRKNLLKFDSNTQLPRQAKGEILIDGVLLAARELQERKEEITVRVESIVLGNGDSIPQELTIISPQERYGGIAVVVGEQYRLLVVPINGKYYSWAAAGSAPTDSAFDGFYKCTKEQTPISVTKP